MKLKDFIKPSNWCKEQYAKDHNGRAVQPTDPKACKFCMMGAMRHIYPEWSTSGSDDSRKYTQTMAKIAKTLPKKYAASVVEFNDRVSYSTVRKLLVKANV